MVASTCLVRRRQHNSTGLEHLCGLGVGTRARSPAGQARLGRRYLRVQLHAQPDACVPASMRRMPTELVGTIVLALAARERALLVSNPPRDSRTPLSAPSGLTRAKRVGSPFHRAFDGEIGWLAGRASSYPRQTARRRKIPAVPVRSTAGRTTTK